MWPGGTLWEPCAPELSRVSILWKICNFYPVTEQIEPWLLFHNLGSRLHVLDCMFLILSHFQQLQMFLPLGHQAVKRVYCRGRALELETGSDWMMGDDAYLLLHPPSFWALFKEWFPGFIALPPPILLLCTCLCPHWPHYNPQSRAPALAFMRVHISWTMDIFEIKTVSEDLEYLL